MNSALNCSSDVQLMNPSHQDLWSDAIRLHDRRVFLSVLALGVAPDTAREVTQSTWTKLMEKHADGELPGLQLPGLAIKQARFLALNDIKQTQTQQRALAAVPDRAPESDVQNIVESRQRFERMLEALATCSPTARTVFRMVYEEPPHSHAEVAQHVGLSVQRVRQTLCETRNQIRSVMQGDL